MPQKPEDVVMPFGKHKDKTLGDILVEDAGYLDWLSDAEIRSPALAKAIKEMCTKYEAQIEQAIGDHDEFMEDLRDDYRKD